MLRGGLGTHGCPPPCSIGHNEVIGLCRVGSDAEGPGREHWAQMLANPRKPIEQWHTLVEVRHPTHGTHRYPQHPRDSPSTQREPAGSPSAPRSHLRPW